MTLVSHRARFIFLKTHKTASTSVEAALEPLCAPEGATTGAHWRPESVSEAGVIARRGRPRPGETWRNHMGARAVRAKVGWSLWADYEKISIVRNPYDRMVSMFHSRLDEAERERLAAAPFDEVRDAFQRWLPTTGRSNNYAKLVNGPRFVVDRLLVFETLEADFAALAGELGLPPDLPRHKTDRRRRAEHWRDYYDDASRAFVARASAFELAAFGYDFDGGPDRARRRPGRLATSPLGLLAARGAGRALLRREARREVREP